MEALSRPAATRERRQAILDAALDCFTERGLAATTIEDVRRRSGASVGSIYHHFQSKQELAGALYLEGLRDYQRGLMAELRAHPEAEAGVRAIVAHHLAWVTEHPDLARFLLHARESELQAATAAPLRELNRELFDSVGGWLDEHVERGVIAPFPRALYPTLLIGPSQEFSRHWLAGRIDLPVAEAQAGLAEATWKALKATRGDR